VGDAQLDARADVPGSFDYIPQFGTQIPAGSDELLSATFHPTDTKDYVSGGKISTSINVKPYRPMLSWNQPQDITYGEKLSVIELDPNSDVVGSFAFNPPMGKRLLPGNHRIKATFTPLDPVDFVPGEAISITLGVQPATLKIQPLNQTVQYGATLPNFSASSGWKASGFVAGDTLAALTSPPICGPQLTVSGQGGAVNVDPGDYALVCEGAQAQNYTMRYVPGTLTVTQQHVALSYAGPSTTKAGASVHLSARLMGDIGAGDPIVGATVLLGFKNGAQCSGLTNSVGTASCAVTAPSKTGHSGVTMMFKGTTVYTSAAGTGAIQIGT
jgi:hypothetical protein